MEENNINNQTPSTIESSQIPSQHGQVEQTLQASPIPDKPKLKLKLPILLAGLVLFLVLIGTASAAYLFITKPKMQVSIPKQNNSLNLSELNGFPIYPNAEFFKKEKTTIACGLSVQGTCYVKGVAYSWSTNDDFIKVSDWFKQNKSQSGWKIQTGKGTYSTGFMAGPGSGGSIVTMSNGTTYYYLTIGSHHSTPTTITLQIPDTPIDPSQNQDSTANWKTYKNPKYNFSLKLPSQLEHLWQEDTNKNQNGGITSVDIDSFHQGKMTECCGYEGPNLNIMIFPAENNSKWADYGATQVGPKAVESVFSIDGMQTKKRVNLPFGIYIGPIIKNGYVYNFQIFSKSGGQESEFTEIYQILSTFKFTPLTGGPSNPTPTCMPQPSICKNPQVGAYPKECDEPTNGWCPE